MDRFNISDYTLQYAEQYAEGAFETHLVRIRRENVLGSLARYPHQRVLEVGCGLEPLFPFVKEVDHYTVIEPSQEFVANAIRLAGDRAEVRVLHGFLEEEVERLSGTPFDFIIVSSLLHEVPDPDLLLRSVRDLAGAETVVHINVPNVLSFHRLLALEMGLIEDVFEASEAERRFQRQTRFDQTLLAATVKKGGFQIEESGSYFLKPFTHAQMEQLLRAGIVGPELLRGLEGMIRYLPNLGSEIYVNLRRVRMAHSER